MASDFSRTLALLRKENKISQRVAANDLQVSQALLSHYENGLREPGLGFVVKAAHYYNVTTDYLLGCSMARDGITTVTEHIPDNTNNAAGYNQRMITSATALLFDIAEKANNEQLAQQIETYLSMAIYKVFRYLYEADRQSTQAVFRNSGSEFDYLCDSQMKLSELKIKLAAKGHAGYGIEQQNASVPAMDLAIMAREYPTLAPAMLGLLQSVSELLSDLENNYEKHPKK